MGELIFRDRIRVPAAAAPTRAVGDARSSGATEARDAIVAFGREVDAVAQKLAALDAAYAANDRARWTDCRSALDHELVFAEEALARTHVGERAAAELADQLATSRRAFAEQLVRANAATEPPAGYAQVAGELDAIAALGATPESRSRLAFDTKERALAVWIDGLSLTDARVLTTRLRIARADDPIVAAFARLSAQRRARLTAYLADLPRRAALRAAGAQHGAIAQGALAVASELATDVTRVISTVSHGATLVRETSAEQLAAFVHEHARELLDAIRDAIDAAGIAQPHDRVSWTSLGDAASAIGAAIYADVRAAGTETLARLAALAAPEDLADLAHEVCAHTTEWKPEYGVALATVFTSPVDTAIRRMGERLHARFVTRSVLPSSHELVASCPLDGLIADVLTTRGMVVVASGVHSVAHVPRRTFVDGVRIVDCEWLGARDASLWNWIRAIAPRDATAEDVAHTLLAGDAGRDGSTQAYRLVERAPYFGVPVELAHAVPEMVRHAPPDQHAAPQRGVDATSFARSAAADDAAREATPQPTADDPSVERAVRHVRMQIAFLCQRLAPWRLDGALVPASEFVERRVVELDADPSAAPRWQGALGAQERVLRVTAVETLELLRELEANVTADTAPAAATAIVAAYARAAGASHLPRAAVAELQAARHARAMLPLALAEQQIRGAAVLVAATDSPSEAGRGVFELVTRAARLRQDAEAGKRVDGDTVDALALDAEETALRARLDAIEGQLRAIDRRADELGLSTHVFADHLPTVRAMTFELLRRPHGEHAGKLGEWRARLDAARRGAVGLPQTDQIAAVRAALREVEGGLAAFQKESDFGAWLPYAQERIADLELRQLLIGLAKQLGEQLVIGVVCSVIGGGAFAMVRGIGAVKAALTTSTTVATLVGGAELVAQAGLNTLGQGLVGGELSGRELASNVIAYGVAAAAMKPFEGLLARSHEVEREVARSLAGRATRAGSAVLELGAETGAGIAGDLVGHALTRRDDGGMPDGADWLIQGVSIAATRFVGERMRWLYDRLERVPAALGAGGKRLLARIDALRGRAEATRAPTRAAALELLNERMRALREIMGTVELHLSGPSMLKPIEAVEHEIARTPLEVPLVLSGLEPVIEGYLYEGGPEEIQRGLESVRGAGPTVDFGYDPESGTHSLKTGTRTIQLREKRAVFHTGANKNRERINHVVPGLYDDLDPSLRFRDGSLTDTVWDHEGVVNLKTSVTDANVPTEAPQILVRGYDAASETLFMKSARLNKLGKWVKTPARGMDPIDGIPTVTYLTLRQMKLLGIPFGGLRRVVMNGVENIRSVIELEAMRQSGIPLDKAAASTHSVGYASGAIVQSGHRIESVLWQPGHSDFGGEPLEDLLHHWETCDTRYGEVDPELHAEHNHLIETYGKGLVDRNTRVLIGYDVVLFLAPLE